MKILVNHSDCFQLAHGGFSTQIIKTVEALRNESIEVEYLRWWDKDQLADHILYFGRPHPYEIKLAQEKGIKFSFMELLTGQASRSSFQLFNQRLLVQGLGRIVPSNLQSRLGWESYKLADQVFSLTPWEAELMEYIFGRPQNRIQIVPNGVADVFKLQKERTSGDWLVCTATITNRKNILHLCELALRSKTKVWIIGKPYSPNNPYFKAFISLQKQHSELIRYEGAIDSESELAEVYQNSRGFVMLSTMESLSLSTLEASAAKCPLLLTDLPWAKTTFGDKASYINLKESSKVQAKKLRTFYEISKDSSSNYSPLSWRDVAKEYIKAFHSLS